MRRICLVLTVLFVVVSCSANRGESPQVTLTDVTFGDLTLFETSAEFVVRIENPNPFPIVIDGAKHDLFINEAEIGKGLADQKLEIPRLGSATQRVTVRLSNLSIARNVEHWIDSRDFNYRIESTLYIPGTFGVSSYRVSNSGRFPS